MWVLTIIRHRARASKDPVCVDRRVECDTANVERVDWVSTYDALSSIRRGMNLAPKDPHTSRGLPQHDFRDHCTDQEGPDQERACLCL